jgi:hypothetical protein
MTLSRTTFSRNGLFATLVHAQYIAIMLGVRFYLFVCLVSHFIYCYAEYCYAKCHYDECRGAMLFTIRIAGRRITHKSKTKKLLAI